MQLGAFRLERVLAAGGMGQVWRAVHAGGIPAAVKLALGGGTNSGAVRAFDREISAIARLDHPGIVRLYDAGWQDDDAGPWLAMELAVGTLEDTPPAHGDGAVAVLDGLLAALAHAHARGVVHRDLKPSNLLRTTDGQLRVADFGIASVREADGGVARGGTPAYMAPEQVRGDHREQGPRTDLYAVGCLAWWLASGSPPFAGPDAATVCAAHLGREPPDLGLRFPVAEGFEAWTRTLLAKRPEDRFASCAEARAALAALGPAPAPDGPIRAPMVEGRTWSTDAELALPVAAPDGPGVAVARGRILVPPTWRDGEPAGPDPRLDGVGLGLFPRRTPRLVGRDAERDALWARLLAVEEQGRAGAVVLRGPVGVGKSRLSAWLAERVHELGCAVALVVRHHAPPAATDGVAAALEDALGTVGLARGAFRRRAERRLPTGVAGDLEDLLRPAPGTAPPTSDIEVLAAAIGALAAAQPVVLWIDDAPDGLAAIDVAARLGDSPVLVVATARQDHPRADEVAARLGADELVVTPLDQPTARALLTPLLGLAPRLLEQVVERSGGFPLFALQVVADWVHRGALVWGGEGFALAPGASPRIPDGLHGLFRERVERALAGRPPDDRAALERAATLGVAVDRDEWAEAQARDGLLASDALVASLVAAGLARPTEAGFELAHPLLAESLLRSADEADRASAHRRACAAVLAGRGRAAFMTRSATAALPLLDRAVALSDDPAALAGGLRFRADAHRRVGRSDRALADLDAALALPDRAADPALDGMLHGTRARTLLDLGRLEEADAAIERSTGFFRVHGHPRMLALSLSTSALVAARRGEPRRGADLAREGARLLEGTTDPALAMVLEDLVSILRTLGEVEEAFAAVRRADALHVGAGNDRMRLQTLTLEGTLHLDLRELEAAAARFRQARAIALALGDGSAAAGMTGRLGLVALREGDLAGARAALEEALAATASAPTATHASLLYGLAEVDAREGRFAAAREGLARSRAALDGVSNTLLAALHATVTARIEAWAGDRLAATVALAQARELARAMGAGPSSVVARAVAEAERALEA